MKTKLVVETFDINNMDKMFFLHCFFVRFLVKNHESLLGLECITITQFSHVQCIWWWRRLVLWSNTAKTWEGQVHCRRNSTPLPSIGPDEWWVMKDEREGKKQTEEKQGWGKEETQNKRTSVEKERLFGEGRLQSDKVKQALLSRVRLLKRGKHWKEEARRIRERRDRETGGIKRTNTESVCFKNIWEPSASGEKNAGLSWNTSLPLLRCLPARLLHIQLTPSPKRHKVEGGWVQSIREPREFRALQALTPVRLQGLL